jgi:hypothetical protein
LHEAVSRDKKRYSNLTSCILAAVFSINARYKVVIATLKRYRAFYDLPPPGVPNGPAGTGEPRVSEFISQVEAQGVEDFAANVLHNRMRTSSKGGVLKAQAALDFARVLQRYGIEEISQVLTCPKLAELELDLRRVHGQSSGISTDYFMMNVGDTHRVKPDRWVIGFLVDTLNRSVSQAEAQLLFKAVCPELATEYPGITPRALDLAVWKWKSNWNDTAAGTGSKRQALERQIAATEQRLERLRRRLKQIDG